MQPEQPSVGVEGESSAPGVEQNTSFPVYSALLDYAGRLDAENERNLDNDAHLNDDAPLNDEAYLDARPTDSQLSVAQEAKITRLEQTIAGQEGLIQSLELLLDDQPSLEDMKVEAEMRVATLLSSKDDLISAKDGIIGEQEEQNAQLYADCLAINAGVKETAAHIQQAILDKGVKEKVIAAKDRQIKSLQDLLALKERTLGARIVELEQAILQANSSEQSLKDKIFNMGREAKVMVARACAKAVRETNAIWHRDAIDKEDMSKVIDDAVEEAVAEALAEEAEKNRSAKKHSAAVASKNARLLQGEDMRRRRLTEKIGRLESLVGKYHERQEFLEQEIVIVKNQFVTAKDQIENLKQKILGLSDRNEYLEKQIIELEAMEDQEPDIGGGGAYIGAAAAESIARGGDGTEASTRQRAHENSTGQNINGAIFVAGNVYVQANAHMHIDVEGENLHGGSPVPGSVHIEPGVDNNGVPVYGRRRTITSEAQYARRRDTIVEEANMAVHTPKQQKPGHRRRISNAIKNLVGLKTSDQPSSYVQGEDIMDDGRVFDSPGASEGNMGDGHVYDYYGPPVGGYAGPEDECEVPEYASYGAPEGGYGGPEDEYEVPEDASYGAPEGGYAGYYPPEGYGGPEGGYAGYYDEGYAGPGYGGMADGGPGLAGPVGGVPACNRVPAYNRPSAYAGQGFVPAGGLSPIPYPAYPAYVGSGFFPAGGDRPIPSPGTDAHERR